MAGVSEADLLQRGLSQKDAEKKLQDYGSNSLPDIQSDTLFTKLLQQYRNPLIYILLFALAIELGLWGYHGFNEAPVEAVAIFLILLANGLLGFWQGVKSDSAMQNLKNLTSPKSWVVRNSELQKIESSSIVPGDIVKVDSGERIAADGLVLKAEGFLVDESILTGESVPADKKKNDSVCSGTLVARGSAWFEVQATGPNSSMGKLAGMLQGVEIEKTPLEKRLAVMAQKIAIIVMCIATVILVLGLATVGTSHFAEIFLFAIALAVAAVPESLPAVITLALALGIERMAKRNAVVRKMSAVESLGSVTVIATDKTGTLTENKMAVAEVDADDKEQLVLAMLLVNDANLETGNGDPLELGMLRYVSENKVDIDAKRALYPRVSCLPFDAEWKYMRVTVDDGDEMISFIKGAPEVVLQRSKLSGDERKTIEDKIEGYANQGYRTLALAKAIGEKEDNLEWLGLILLLDPPRVEVADAIKRSQQAGIRVLMVTGDHPGTAREIGRQVGIESDRAITGDEFSKLDKQALQEVVRHCNVFSRMAPEHKLKLVETLQSLGEVVAVTGDGVNDAPALKTSDVGVAMGQRGSDVSREVADLILLDDNFSTIVNAVEEGRNIYENIQKFIRVLFSTNITEVALISIGAFFVFLTMADNGTLVLPLTAAQILWINLLTDSLPALAIAFDRSPGVLNMPARDTNSPLLDKPTLLFIVLLGVIGSIASLVLLFGLPFAGYMPEQTQSIVFCFLTVVQMSFVLPARRSNIKPFLNKLVYLALFVVLAAQVAVFTVPALRALFNLEAMTLAMFTWVMVPVVICWLVAELISFLIRKKTEIVATVKP